jgi:hypothetical protein
MPEDEEGGEAVVEESEVVVDDESTLVAAVSVEVTVEPPVAEDTEDFRAMVVASFSMPIPMFAVVATSTVAPPAKDSLRSREAAVFALMPVITTADSLRSFVASPPEAYV